MYEGELIKSREREHSGISRYSPAPPSRYTPRSVTSSISVSLAFIRPSSPIHLRTSRFSSLASRLCFFAPASSTARKKINTRRTRRHKASLRRGNYVGPRIMRPRSDRVRSRALRASAPNNKGRTVNDDKWKISENLENLAFLLFHAIPLTIQLMIRPRAFYHLETLVVGLVSFDARFFYDDGCDLKRNQAGNQVSCEEMPGLITQQTRRRLRASYIKCIALSFDSLLWSYSHRTRPCFTCLYA